MGFTEFELVVMGYVGFDWVLQVLIELKWVQIWVASGLTGFDHGHAWGYHQFQLYIYAWRVYSNANLCA